MPLGGGPGSRVVVSSTSVEGTDGPWTTKQRLILAAMAIETARASLPVRTPTFALLRTPVTFLVAGTHQKIDTCYAFRVDPQSGALATVVWVESADGLVLPARRPSVRVFDSPMDVQARRILGGIPVSWSFAVQQLPPGTDVDVPASFRDRAKAAADQPAAAVEVEQAFARLLAGGP